MNITRENIDELNAILTVSVEKNDYEATVNDVLKNYRKKANMPDSVLEWFLLVWLRG